MDGQIEHTISNPPTASVHRRLLISPAELGYI